MSSLNFILSLLEYDSFITSGPVSQQKSTYGTKDLNQKKVISRVILWTCDTCINKKMFSTYMLFNCLYKRSSISVSTIIRYNKIVKVLRLHTCNLRNLILTVGSDKEKRLSNVITIKDQKCL